MGHLNFDNLNAASVATDPYMFVVVPGFLSGDSLRHINETYPNITMGGSLLMPLKNE